MEIPSSKGSKKRLIRKKCYNDSELGTKMAKMDQPPNWEKLPVEIWHHIFSSLPMSTVFKLQMVNTTFQLLVKKHTAHRSRLNINTPLDGDKKFTIETPFTDDILGMLFENYGWNGLRILHLQGENVEITSNCLSMLGIKNLEEALITCSRVEPGHFGTFVLSNPKLRVFSFQAKSGYLILESLQILFENCLRLTHLCFDCKFVFGVNELDNVEEKAKTLFKRKPSNLFLFSMESHRRKTAKKLELLICFAFASSLVVASLYEMPKIPMPNLKQVFVSEFVECEINYWKNRQDTRPLYWDKFPKLQSLIFGGRWPEFAIDLSFFSFPNCNIVDLVLRHCKLHNLTSLKNLNCLDLNLCKYAKKKDIMEMLKKNTTLTRLSLESICKPSCNVLDFIGETCQNLQILDITDRFTTPDFETILAFAKARVKNGKQPQSQLTILAEGGKI